MASPAPTPGTVLEASGERIVVAPVDVSALRHERATRRGHHMLAHLRTEAYPVYAGRQFPRAAAVSGGAAALSYEQNCQRIDQAKRSLRHVETSSAKDE